MLAATGTHEHAAAMVDHAAVRLIASHDGPPGGASCGWERPPSTQPPAARCQPRGAQLQQRADSGINASSSSKLHRLWVLGLWTSGKQSTAMPPPVLPPASPPALAASGQPGGHDLCRSVRAWQQQQQQQGQPQQMVEQAKRPVWLLHKLVSRQRSEQGGCSLPGEPAQPENTSWRIGAMGTGAWAPLGSSGEPADHTAPSAASNAAAADCSNLHLQQHPAPGSPGHAGSTSDQLEGGQVLPPWLPTKPAQADSLHRLKLRQQQVAERRRARSAPIRPCTSSAPGVDALTCPRDDVDCPSADHWWPAAGAWAPSTSSVPGGAAADSGASISPTRRSLQGVCLGVDGACSRCPCTCSLSLPSQQACAHGAGPHACWVPPAARNRWHARAPAAPGTTPLPSP